MYRASLLAFIGFFLLFSGCDTFSSDDAGITIETDKAAYVLERRTGIYTTPMVVKITNHTQRDVYLNRQCGFMDTPARSIERLIDTNLRTELDRLSCPLILYSVLPPPFVIKPGETYSDVFNLQSLEQLGANPIVRAEHRTGLFRFRYQLHTVKTKGNDGQFEEENLVSNAFSVDLE